MQQPAQRTVRSTLIRISLLLITLWSGSGCGGDQKAQQQAAASQQKDSLSMSADSTSPFAAIPFTTITGEPASLASYAGNVVVIVNTASECGYTPQYAGLENLYEKYKSRGLVVLGFPANNFGGQEPGSNEQIAQFCSAKFGVTFPMMAKVSVAGDDIHPLFAQLTGQPNLPGPISWNFSKFVLDRSGRLVARFPSSVEPESPELQAKLQELL